MLSLRDSLILMLVVVVAIPLLLFWAWPHSNARHHTDRQVHERHLLIARNISAALQRYHHDVKASFEFAGDGLLQDLKIPPAQQLLENLRFKAVCLLDPRSGNVLKGLAGTGACPAAFSKKMLGFFNNLAKEGSTVFSGVHADAIGQPRICLVRLVGGKMVVGVIDTNYFVKLAKTVSFGVRGHAAIVDHTGKVLAHPLPAWEAEMKDISKVSAVQRMLAGGEGVDTFYSPALKQDMIAGFTAVKGPGWGVMVPQPVTELTETAPGIQNSVLIVFTVGLIVAALAACRLALLLVWPVERVIGAANRMSRGEDGVRIDGSMRYLPTEFKDLADSFNAMAERVETARAAATEAKQAAEEANASKTEFLRTVTHELRSPLNAIIGFADLLATGECGEPGGERHIRCAEDIRAGSKHLLSLTNDLLDLARIEAGQYDLIEEEFGLDEIASRAARFVEPEAAARGTAVKVQAGDNPPAVRADERALFQSVLNLASNAVRYGRQNGHVVISVRLREAGDAEITIADNGPGISPEDMERVLEPFQRVASVENRDVRGSGLGLSIVRRLAELHGGSFRLESTLDIGTRAYIILPASRVVPDDSEDLRPAA